MLNLLEGALSAMDKQAAEEGCRDCGASGGPESHSFPWTPSAKAQPMLPHPSPSLPGSLFPFLLILMPPWQVPVARPGVSAESPSST